MENGVSQGPLREPFLFAPKDFEQALEPLMRFYAGGPLLRWDRLPAEACGRLDEVARVILDRFPNNPARPEALVSVALARYRDRDDDGRLRPQSAAAIRKHLEQVVTDHRDSAVFATAMVGLIRTDVETGNRDRAARRYDEFRDFLSPAQ